ncbi:MULTISPECIES: hypothetical protein [unclassified Sporolactobacillus]|uniref:hypothetical protein n=1 Tax=unclassified Sporolactobacillus TaxID=2628533 RepID=UPI0023679458|nr:hypothetical protein [Sporolactobacillus sp. CQH2019]MDD9147776.1 hypothetical protein [Sporolactobacillus sp. CQH2019]
MKKILAVLCGIVLLLSLAACGSQSVREVKSIPANKLTAQEKTAVDFTEGLYSGNKSKQYKAIDQFAARTSIKGLKEKISVGGFRQQFHAVSVIKGKNIKGQKGDEFVALLEMKDQNNTVNKRIVVMGSKVLHILSGNTQPYANELGS